MDTPKDPSRVIYDTLHAAFDHFNNELFNNRLPPVMLVLHRKRNAHGYFWNGVWRQAGESGEKLSEIALNPQTMGRSPEEVLSTLVHEMVHHEQHVFGKPGKSIGHNKEWAEWMDRVGLVPSTTAAPGGKRTGRNCSHYIEEGGPFSQVCARFLESYPFDMRWFSPTQTGPRKKDRSKVKHTCPSCGANIWCREGLHMICGVCDVDMQEAV